MSANKNRYNSVSLLYSIGFIFIESFAFKGLAKLQLPPFLEQGGHYQFLTNIALSLSTVYFFINVLYHGLKFDQLFTLKQYFSALCLSLNSVVSIVYWGLKFTLTHLIMSHDGDRIPLYLDILIHVLPLLFVALDYFVFMNRWSISYFEAYSIIAFCSALYWGWLEYLLDGQESYPYPFLNVETTHRIVIFFLVSMIAFIAFVCGKLLHPEFIEELEEAEKDFSKKYN